MVLAVTALAAGLVAGVGVSGIGVGGAGASRAVVRHAPSSHAGTTTSRPPVAASVEAPGYWLATANGGVFAAGAAPSLGGTIATRTNPVVGIAATRDGQGYWLVERDGNVLAFGSAHPHGTLPGMHTRVSDIVAIAPTGDGGGYWLIGRDGGEFAFGDAHYHGSLPGLGIHVRDIAGMVATSDGNGYWLVGSDGGVFAFGDARYVGSLPNIHVHVHNIMAMIASPTRHGYVLVGSDGGAFVFGTGVNFYGSLPGRGIRSHDIIGLALTADAHGYWLAGANGATYAFGNAIPYAAPAGLSQNLPVVAIAGTPRSTASSTSASWQIQKTPVYQQGGQLNAVRCTVSNNCVAVGYYLVNGLEKAFSERWNGSKWTVSLPPIPGLTSSLQGISCTSSTFCMAVGSFGNGVTATALAERWNGTSWSALGPPGPAGATIAQLNSVSCVATNACAAVGSYQNSTGTTFTLAETWNGSSWHITGTPNPPGSTLSQLLGVSCVSAKACMAVGNFTKGHEVTLSESWNGASWTIRGTVEPSGARAGSLTNVKCFTTGCFAVGDYLPALGNQTTLAEHWNGSGWAVQGTPGVKGSQESQLDAVSCVNSSDCTAVGFYVAPKTNASLTTAEAWNGHSWGEQSTPSPAGALTSVLDDVSCAATTFCTAVGNEITSSREDVPLAEQWVLHIGTSTTVSSTNKTAVTGQPVVVTATVKPTLSGFGSPTGTVTFTVKGKSSSVSCSAGNTVGVSGGVAHCSIPSGKLLASQSPYAVSVKYNGAADFNASSGSLSPSLSVGKDGTSLTVTSSANPAVYSQTFNLTATVKASSPGAGAPTGTVTFSVDSGRASCDSGTNTFSVNSHGQAVCPITQNLPIGKHTVVATYNADSNFLGSTNGKTPLSETVNKDGTTLTITSSANPAVYTQFYTLTATVKAKAPGRAVPTGTVTFSVGGNGVCDDGTNTFHLNSKGQAVCPVQTSLVPGTYNVIGTYSGDTNFLSSTDSPVFKQIVKTDGTSTAVTGPASAFAPAAVTFAAVVSPHAPATETPFGNVTFTSTLSGGSPLPLNCNNTGSDVVTISFNGQTGREEADCATTIANIGTYTITGTYNDPNPGWGSSFGTTTITVSLIP
jgi:hypothetical protein